MVTARRCEIRLNFVVFQMLPVFILFAMILGVKSRVLEVRVFHLCTGRCRLLQNPTASGVIFIQPTHGHKM